MSEIKCISLSDMRQVEIKESTILCLGNFDGVHRAHQALLKRTIELCHRSATDAKCGVFCFREPSWIFLSDHPSEFLCTVEQKLQYFRDAGIDYAFVADFPALKTLSPSAFIQTILKDKCRAIGVVCGFNYRFGIHGSGTPTDLSTEFGNNAVVEQEIRLDGEVISSTQIRSLLKAGHIRTANRMLGRAYSLTAKVVHGKSLGKKLGAPTINQSFPPDMLIPRCGVYVSQCLVAGKIYRGVSNIGRHPTIDQNATVNCETYLIDFQGDLYDIDLTIEFLHFLREEKRFASSDELAKQIQADVKAACEWKETEAVI